MVNELHVFLNEERIGTLTQENGAMSFAYVPEYLHTGRALRGTLHPEIHHPDSRTT